jgi:hypothetical protein
MASPRRRSSWKESCLVDVEGDDAVGWLTCESEKTTETLACARTTHYGTFYTLFACNFLASYVNLTGNMDQKSIFLFLSIHHMLSLLSLDPI